MINIKKVCKTYTTGSSDNEVLSNINFQLPAHGLIYIVGPSGSGKTSLLNIISLLDIPTTGEVEILGLSTKEMNENDLENCRGKVIGIVFQERNLITELSVGENVELSNKIINKPYVSKDIIEVLNSVGLRGYYNRNVNHLSTGEKQRVAISRALVKQPKIIVADEPTASLDSYNAREVNKILKSISKKRLVVIVSHSLEDAYYYGDRVIKLDNKKIVNDEVINNLNYDEIDYNYQFENKYMSNFYLFKLMLKRIRNKKFQTLLSIVIVSLSLIVLSYSFVFTSYSSRDYMFRYLEENEDFINIGYNNVNLDSSQTVYFTYQDYEIIKESFSNYNVYLPFNIQEEYNDYLIDDNYINPSYYWTWIECGVSFNNEQLTEFGYETVYGTLPSNDKEIMITKYMYNIFEDFGYETEDNQYSIDSYSDIIGKSISITTLKNDFEIVGIIDVNSNIDQFDPLRNSTTNYYSEEETDILANTIILTKYMDRCLFFNEDFNENYIFENDYNYIYNTSSRPSNYEHDPKLLEITNSLGEFQNFAGISNNEYINSEDFILKDDIDIKNLNENQILVYKIDEDDSFLNLDDEINNKTLDIVDEYASHNFADIKYEFEQEMGLINTSYEDYAQYIVDNPINNYDQIYNIEYFIYTASKLVYDEYIFSSNYNISSEIVIDVDLIIENYSELEIVGISKNSRNMSGVILNNNIYDKFNDEMNSQFDFGMIALSDNSKNNKYIYDYTLDTLSYSPNNWGMTILEYQTTNQVENATTTIRIFVALSFVLSAFLIYFINELIIKDYKYSIVIMKSMGIKKKDVYKLFVFRFLIISLSSFFITSIALQFVGDFSRLIFTTNSCQFADVIITSCSHYFVLLLILILISFLTAYLFLVRFSKKQIIQLIEKNT